jgi:hypothetical protein
VSLTLTAWAFEGPALATVIVYVYVTPSPAVTLLTPSDLVIERLAWVWTVVVAVEVLLAVFGSFVAELTVAVFVSGPAGVAGSTVALIRTTTLPAAAIVPRLTEPVHGVAGVQPAPVQYCSLSRAAGSGSLRVTLSASDGPLLVTVIVYVTTLPAMTGSGVTVLRSATSAARLTRVVAVELLFAAAGSAVAFVAIAAVLDRVVPSATLEATLTTICQVTLPPAARPAEVQVTVPATLPQAGLADTKLVPAGIVSPTVKPVLSEGPRLSTVIV